MTIMHTLNSGSGESAVVLPLSDFRIRKLAREYVDCYLRYGVECAALWTMDRIRLKDRKPFNRSVRYEFRKRGIFD